jgi:hypothetical protein
MTHQPSWHPGVTAKEQPVWLCACCRKQPPQRFRDCPLHLPSSRGIPAIRNCVLWAAATCHVHVVGQKDPPACPFHLQNTLAPHAFTLGQMGLP